MVHSSPAAPSPTVRTAGEVTGTLLVVDDNESNRDLLSRRLERRGHRVLVAAGGREALRLVQTEAIDLLLLDVEMPEMSGLEVLQVIRADDATQRLPVLMVTAQDQSAQIVTAFELGADDYITKPIDFPVALARIRTQLLRRQAEELVRESEQQYALAAAGANDGLWDWKIAANRLYFSPRWKAIVGHAADDDIGSRPQDLFDRIHPDDRARVRREVESHLAGLTAFFESEHRIRHASGAYRWALSRGLATRDGDGVATRMAGSLTDVTDGKAVDALTGLPNRLLLTDRLERVFQQTRHRSDRRFAVLFLDLDGFKVVNDSLGHLAGDRLLQAVARRLESALRGSDGAGAGTAVTAPEPEHTLARLGGDEFVVLLHDVKDVLDATRVADGILHAFGRPFPIDGREVFTEASIGIAVSTDAYTRASEVMRDADTAMYRAKTLGKGRAEVFDADMRERVTRRLQLDTALRVAIERHEFVPFFQPLIDMKTGRLVGFEALIRWRHPERGIVSPSEFVPVLEEKGLIVPVGRRLVQEVCSHLGTWRRDLPQAANLWVNVNFAGQQLADDRLAMQLLETLEDAQLGPADLVVEITEATAISNLELTNRVLAGVREAGMRVALDDFGTGYSSLACLDELPITGLKLDPTFTARHGRRSAILRAVVGLASALEFTVTAEGIETETQRRDLRDVGCHYGQGYLFARPLAPEAVAEVIARDARWFPEETDDVIG
jgi:diguanylate cyclase (GGDEF)-like protein/PAS domain S-box-containing protein